MYYSVFRLEVCVMEHRLPYYMAYPMPMQYDDERMERRDFEYMKSMYPMAVKRLLPFVEEECDRMSYEGSMIYDEYPDQLQIRMMCNRIFYKVRDLEDEENAEKESWFKELIQIMLLLKIMELGIKFLCLI